MLDTSFVRSQFPALRSPWALMDNAGGSDPCRHVIDRIRDFIGFLDRIRRDRGEFLLAIPSAPGLGIAELLHYVQ